jgi:hypothetical protein
MLMWFFLWLSVGILGIWMIILTVQFHMRGKEWDEAVVKMLVEARSGRDDDDSYATLEQVRKMSIESGVRTWDEFRRVQDKLRALEARIGGMDIASGELLRQIQANNGKVQDVTNEIDSLAAKMGTAVASLKTSQSLCDADRKAMSEQLASACKNLDAICDRVAALEKAMSDRMGKILETTPSSRDPGWFAPPRDPKKAAEVKFDNEWNVFSQPLKLRTDAAEIVHVPGPEKPGEKSFYEVNWKKAIDAMSCETKARPFLSFGDGVQWRVGDSLHTGKPVLLDNGGYVLDGDDVMVKHDYGCGISFVPQLHLSPYPSEPIPEPTNTGATNASQQ